MENQQNKRPAQLLLLDKFAGNWQTTGTLRINENEQVSFKGTDRYEWLPGGFFMLHTVDVMMNGVRKENIEIIGYDPLSDTYPMHF